MLRLLSIASGSSGNCIYLGSDHTHVLIDAGISRKRIEEGLDLAGIKPEELAGIFVTHEHSDHVKSLGIMARKYGIPMYATEGTLDAVRKDSSQGRYDTGLFRIIEPDSDVQLGDLTVHPFHTYHDAADPVGYRIASGRFQAAVATDTGHFDDYLVDNLKNLNAVLLESNHDVRMLEAGTYPYYLKRRILGDCGHLSNENCGRLLCQVLNDDLEHVFLGHLSKENNIPELAYEAVRCEIAQENCGYMPDDFHIEVASREHPGSLVEIL